MVMKKTLLFVSVLIIGVIIVISLLPSEKKRVKKVIVKCRDAVVAEDVDALMDHVSFNYSDDHSGSYLQVKNTAEKVFSTYDDFDLSIDIMSISINEDRAKADIKISMIASDEDTRGYMLGDAGGPQDVQVYFGKGPYVWKINRIDGLFGQTGQAVFD